MTIGTVEVACCAARVAAGPVVRITGRLLKNRVSRESNELLCGIGPSTVDHEGLPLDPSEFAKRFVKRSIFGAADCR